MQSVLRFISPRNYQGAFLWAVLSHIGIYLTVVFVLGSSLNQALAPKKEETIDFGYQTFDEPPPEVKEVRRVVKAPDPETPVEKKSVPDNSPKELQDDKGVVSGTQGPAKPVASQVGSDSNGTAASTPYYRIKPKYPKAALVSGAEGWVMMQIDINEKGEVENVRVVDGEQKNLFQSEARRAVEQWKYKPFVDSSGKPFRKIDHQVRVDFKLQDAG